MGFRTSRILIAAAGVLVGLIIGQFAPQCRIRYGPVCDDNNCCPDCCVADCWDSADDTADDGAGDLEPAVSDPDNNGVKWDKIDPQMTACLKTPGWVESEFNSIAAFTDAGCGPIASTTTPPPTTAGLRVFVVGADFANHEKLIEDVTRILGGQDPTGKMRG